ncbi:conserved hypothetical protein [Planktothrix paucivesiculata PCC 9631]|uniref:Uncharacterized protein n=1 Tax=Planktothrix paucivesiculata PCC 9631 TaxID=671071 RepID=A0A7Z9BX73_9CYAN|nr:conserved hypothetical protein [Planktothrix paucivesiculata PCC 9631]
MAAGEAGGAGEAGEAGGSMLRRDQKTFFNTRLWIIKNLGMFKFF